MSRVRGRSWLEPEDLSVRARRDSLSATEREALEQALSASETLAVAHRVGMDFDRIGVVRSGDDELVSRVADAAVKIARLPGRPGLRRRRLLLGLAAALMLAGSAAAFWSASSRRAPSAPSASHRGPRLTSAPSLAPSALSVAAPDPSGDKPVPLSESANTMVHVSEPSPRAASDAAELFREATAARHVGDFGHARGLYLRLETEFPASLEAQLAHVSLGKVLLSMGRASEAERQFGLYLRTGGALTEEALLGRAQSLTRLGRRDEERHVWERLLQDFPSSVYGAQARERLSALTESRP